MTARAKALDFEKQAKAWLACETTETKARISDVIRLAGRASKDFSIYSVQLLRRSAGIAADLELRCENVLRNRHFHNSEEDVFSAIFRWGGVCRCSFEYVCTTQFRAARKAGRQA